MIKIKDVKRIREELGLSHLVILGINKEGQHVATHGKSKLDAKQAAEMGNHLKKEWLHWPKDLCEDKPIDRICGNCEFYKYPDVRDVTYGGSGKCYTEPKVINRNPNDRGCNKFEPNY